MAERRMFAKTIIDSDAFLDLPLSAQALYFHVNMRADDEGFINNPRRIQRMIGAADDDLKLLIAKGFLIMFESGVVVVKHWKINNYIQKDRYKETVYLEEKEQLKIKENKAYTLDLNVADTEDIRNGYSLDTECIHDGYSLDSQYSIDKNSIDKFSLVKDIYTASPTDVADATPVPVKPKKHKLGQYQNVLLTDEEVSKQIANYGETRFNEALEWYSDYIKRKGYKRKDDNLCMRKWVYNAVEEDKAKHSNSFSNGQQGNDYNAMEDWAQHLKEKWGQ